MKQLAASHTAFVGHTSFDSLHAHICKPPSYQAKFASPLTMHTNKVGSPSNGRPKHGREADARLAKSTQNRRGMISALGVVLGLALETSFLLDPAPVMALPPPLHQPQYLDSKSFSSPTEVGVSRLMQQRIAHVPSSATPASEPATLVATAVASPSSSSSSRSTAQYLTTLAANIDIEGDVRRNVVSGFTAGFLSRAIKGLAIFPLDTIRVRLQQSKRGSNEEPVQPLQGLTLKSTYAGAIPALLCAGPTAAVFFSVNGALTSLLPTWGVEGSAIVTVIAATLASCLAWGVRTPFEVVKTSVQGGRYGNSLAALKGIVFEEQGLVSLWSPLPRFLAQYLPGDPIKMVTYQYSTAAWALANEGVLSAWQQSSCGAFAYCIVTVLSNPVSVANTRMILEPDKDTNLVQCITRIVSEEGPGVLMAGITPRLGKAAVSGALTFGLFEITRALLQGSFVP